MEPRETIRYTPEEVVKQTECPACGIDMTLMKQRFSHAKKCFSIRRRGPVYRIVGYEECLCGLLVRDGTKAHKMHICVGKVPAYDPRVKMPASPPAKVSLPPAKPAPKSAPAPIKREYVPRLDHRIPQNKRWIRNFTCPIKQKFEDILLEECPEICKPKPKPVPRVRNFDRPSRAPPDQVSVYSIIQKGGYISIAGGAQEHVPKENNVIRKQYLRLPSIQKSGKS